MKIRLKYSPKKIYGMPKITNKELELAALTLVGRPVVFDFNEDQEAGRITDAKIDGDKIDIVADIYDYDAILNFTHQDYDEDGNATGICFLKAIITTQKE